MVVDGEVIEMERQREAVALLESLHLELASRRLPWQVRHVILPTRTFAVTYMYT